MSEMGRCRDCRWWNAEPLTDFDETRGKVWGACLRVESSDSLAEAMGRDPGEGWLTTRPDFGCVQFEAKP
jgi:hypothetical protein